MEFLNFHISYIMLFIFQFLDFKSTSGTFSIFRF